MTIPHEAVPIVTELLDLVAAGRGVMLVPFDEELTTQQAAVLLGMSRPHLVKLLDRGELPHRRVGTHRRLRTEDVIAYRAYHATRLSQAEALGAVIRARLNDPG